MCLTTQLYGICICPRKWGMHEQREYIDRNNKVAYLTPLCLILMAPKLQWR